MYGVVLDMLKFNKLNRFRSWFINFSPSNVSNAHTYYFVEQCYSMGLISVRPLEQSREEGEQLYCVQKKYSCKGNCQIKHSCTASNLDFHAGLSCQFRSSSSLHLGLSITDTFVILSLAFTVGQVCEQARESIHVSPPCSGFESLYNFVWGSRGLIT